jgi:polyvinyl alcohol dehydrogenase (cytochrome)
MYGPILFAQDGSTLYQQRCATCHDAGGDRIPPGSALQKMSANHILRTLDFGAMMSIAYPLRRQEREAIATFLGVPGEDAPLPASAFCPERVPSLTVSSASWTGWSPTSSNTRFQSPQDAGLTAAQVPDLKLKWAFGFRGDITAFGAVTVRGGTLFTGSAGGTVYAMNVQSGCVYWIFQAKGPVRSAPLVVDGGTESSLLFGDLTGWFYALDAKAGTLRWTRRIDDHEATRLTGSPAFHNGVVFVPAASWEETRSISAEYPCCTFRAAELPSSVRQHRLGDRAIMCLLWPSVEIELTWVTRDSLPLIPVVSDRPGGAG